MSWALLWALLVKWEWLCSRLRAHYLLSKSRHLTSPQMIMSKNKWLLHLGYLTQTTKTFPNIIPKITQHNHLLAKSLSICLELISALGQIWKGYRVSSQLTSDNISNCEQDPESDAKRVHFILRVSWLRQTPCLRRFFRNSFTILLSHFFPISVVVSSKNKTRM